MEIGMQNGEIILYKTADGQTEIQLKAIDGTVWLTQAEIANLFQTTPQAITQLIKAIYEEGELLAVATCKEFLQVRKEGSRTVSRSLKSYRLEMILAIGYRVHSRRGVQFRQWATQHLTEYLIKGFVMDDERLKNPAMMSFFDELLERIREVRASEKLFYQKVKDIYVKSMDYDKNSEQAQLFFKTVQNKMLYAVTGSTAAELVVERSDAALSNMGLTSWEGNKTGRGIRKADVVTAKNYLTEAELNEL